MRKKNHIKSLNKFESGMVLRAHDLNNIHEVLLQIADQAGIKLKSNPQWKDGVVLTADSLNILLKDVELILQNLGDRNIKWSFEKFKDGTVLKAEHLNEIVEHIMHCLELF